MPVDDDNVLLTTCCRDRSQNIKFEQTVTQYCIQLDAVRLSCMCYRWWCKKWVCQPLLVKTVPAISQGSVATSLSGGGLQVYC